MAVSDFPSPKTRLIITLVDEQGEERIDSPDDMNTILNSLQKGMSDFIGLVDVDGSMTLIKVDRILTMRLIPQGG